MYKAFALASITPSDFIVALFCTVMHDIVLTVVRFDLDFMSKKSSLEMFRLVS